MVQKRRVYRAGGANHPIPRRTTRSNPSVPSMLLTIPATSAGERGALEEGVRGRNLVKVSPPLARRHQILTRPPVRAPDIAGYYASAVS